MSALLRVSFPARRSVLAVDRLPFFRLFFLFPFLLSDKKRRGDWRARQQFRDLNC